MQLEFFRLSLIVEFRIVWLRFFLAWLTRGGGGRTLRRAVCSRLCGGMQLELMLCLLVCLSRCKRVDFVLRELELMLQLLQMRH